MTVGFVAVLCVGVIAITTSVAVAACRLGIKASHESLRLLAAIQAMGDRAAAEARAGAPGMMVAVYAIAEGTHQIARHDGVSADCLDCLTQQWAAE